MFNVSVLTSHFELKMSNGSGLRTQREWLKIFLPKSIRTCTHNFQHRIEARGIPIQVSAPLGLISTTSPYFKLHNAGTSSDLKEDHGPVQGFKKP